MNQMRRIECHNNNNNLRKIEMNDCTRNQLMDSGKLNSVYTE